MGTNIQRRQELLSELNKIYESGPIIGEDEARREFFIQEELQKTPERAIAEVLADLFVSMPSDGYREEK